MTAKDILFISSAVFVVVGIAALATLGAIAKVPASEYWTVVLGGIGVGLFWIVLITGLHFRAEYEYKHGIED